MKKCAGHWIKPDTVIPLLGCFGFNCLIYWGTMAINRGRIHYDLTTALDRMVPLVPWTIIIYLGCYLFWVVNYIMIGHQEKEAFYRFVTADLLSRVVCGIFFLLLPTTNVRPELPVDSVFTPAMRWLWSMDEASNLFPSIHCLVSWLCYVGIRGRKEIPGWYRAFSCLFAAAVFISTQTTKQHYVVDIIGAVVIAEGCFYVAHHTGIYRMVMKGYGIVNRKLKIVP